MIRLMIYRVRMVPPIPQTIIVTPNVKLSMALPSFKKPWFNMVLDFFDPSTALKPRSEDRGKRSCSGSTLSIPLRKHRVAEGLTPQNSYFIAPI
jgi:hypothetical protein